MSDHPKSMRSLMESIEEASRTDEIGRNMGAHNSFSGVTKDTSDDEFVKLIDEHIKQLRSADSKALARSFFAGDEPIMFDSQREEGQVEHGRAERDVENDLKGQTRSGRIKAWINKAQNLAGGAVTVAGGASLAGFAGVGIALAMGLSLESGLPAALTHTWVIGTAAVFTYIPAMLLIGITEAVFDSLANAYAKKNITGEMIADKMAGRLQALIDLEIKKLEGYKSDPRKMQLFKSDVSETVAKLRREGRLQ